MSRNALANASEESGGRTAATEFPERSGQAGAGLAILQSWVKLAWVLMTMEFGLLGVIAMLGTRTIMGFDWYHRYGNYVDVPIFAAFVFSAVMSIIEYVRRASRDGVRPSRTTLLSRPR